MKVKFLGTSFGAPSVGRHQQSILIESDNGNAYLFDAGAPVLDILVNQGYDLTKIKAVFISHLHGDHMNGLMDILNLTDYFRMKYRIYMPEQRGIDAFKSFSLMQLCGYESDRVSYDLINDGTFFDDGVVKLTAVRTCHMENTGHPSYGFFIETDGSSVYITGDLSPSLKDFPEFLYECDTDMIISECAHFTADELLSKLTKCNVKKAAVLHVMPVERYADLERLNVDLPFELLLPCDNDEYFLGS